VILDFWRQAEIHGGAGLYAGTAGSAIIQSMLALDARQLDAFLQDRFPQAAAFGARIESVTEDKVRALLAVSDRHLRPGATVSGPALMALADFAMYVLLLSRIGPVELAVTTSFNINFMRKPKGDVVAEARLMKLGRSLAVGEVSLFADGSADLIAHATITYAIPPDRKER
jgi:uncharacterized protein (TIGR00369 family)